MFNRGKGFEKGRQRAVINANRRWIVKDEILLVDCCDDRGRSSLPNCDFGVRHNWNWDIFPIRAKAVDSGRMAFSDFPDWSDKPSRDTDFMDRAPDKTVLGIMRPARGMHDCNNSSARSIALLRS